MFLSKQEKSFLSCLCLNISSVAFKIHSYLIAKNFVKVLGLNTLGEKCLINNKV